MRPTLYSIFGCVLLASTFALSSTLALSSTAVAEDEDIAALMDEIGDLADEEKDNNEGLKIALREERAAGREEIADELEMERVSSVSAEIDAEWAALDSQYGGSEAEGIVYCSKDGQEIADCESRRIANNAKVRQNNADWDALEAKETARSDLSDEVKMRQERAREITNRIAILEGRVAALQAAKATAAFEKSNVDCKELPSNEATVQCLMEFWDDARGVTETPELDDQQPQVFSMTSQQRTAEEAIAAFKGSGAKRQLPAGFRTRSLEPPSPK